MLAFARYIKGGEICEVLGDIRDVEHMTLGYKVICFKKSRDINVLLDTKEVKESTPKILKTRAEMRRRW